jgi:hypothetical protein
VEQIELLHNLLRGLKKTRVLTSKIRIFLSRAKMAKDSSLPNPNPYRFVTPLLEVIESNSGISGEEEEL